VRYAPVLLWAALCCWAGPAAAAGRRAEALEVRAVRATEPPVLDGRLDDRAWVEAAIAGSKTTGFVDPGGLRLMEHQPAVYLAWDDAGLYFAARFYGPAPAQPAKPRVPGEFCWDDDVIQIFLEPGLDGRYLNFEVNSIGQSTSGRIGAACVRTAGYWTAEISVPWSVLGTVPSAGNTMGLNIAGFQFANRDWITWSPTYGGFHNPLRFGYLRLGPPPAVRKIPASAREDDF